MKLLKGQHLLLTDGKEVTYIRSHHKDKADFIRVIMPNGKIRLVAEKMIKTNLGPFPATPGKPMPYREFEKLTPDMFTGPQMQGRK